VVVPALERSPSSINVKRQSTLKPNPSTIKTTHHLIRTLCMLIVCCGGFAAAPAQAQAPVLVPSTTEQADGQVRVVFATTAGKSYRIQHSIDLVAWTYYPESIYGFGQTVRYAVHDLPAPTAAAAPPPPAGPRPSEFLFFMITAFSDGSAVAGWAGQDGSQQKAYLPTFDLRYLGQTMEEMVNGTITPTTPALPYYLDVWSWSSPKDPAVVNLQASPTETARLAKLTSQYTWVYNAMKARVDYRAANPGPPPSPPKLFDDKGQPLKQFFRVREYTTDSNFDGIADHLQFGNGGNPYNMDIDGDGIPNGYDRDLWPAATFPATNALLSNVLINEALLANEFTIGDDSIPSKAEDWVELYNPTNTTIDLSGWFLSDSAGNSGRMKWTIPPGTTIGSGQFLVIWASGNNRGGIEDRNGNGVLDPTEDLDGDGVLDAPRAIHTSFSYASGDTTVVPPTNPEPVVLSRPNPAGGTAIIVDSYIAGVTANYAQQRTDVSFGRFPSSAGLQTGYMILPTPGAPGVVGTGSLGPVGRHNVLGALGFTDPPTLATTSSLPGLYEDTTVSAVLLPPATGGAIHFTTNSVHPTRYSELYSGPITATRTRIIRAIAAREGYLPSTSITRSYLFKEDVLGTSPQGTTPTDQQGAKEANGQFKGLLYGYPEATEQASYPMLHGMNAAAVATNRNAISAELDVAPVVSVVTGVPDFFEVATGGLYPNSGKTEGAPSTDPRGREWERACSFEIIESGKSNHTQANAAILITGGSSIRQDTTRKHNLRIKFEKTYGPDSLVYPLFPGVATPEYYNFNLKNPTHDSWSNTWAGFDVRNPATYCNEAFIMDTHKAMGHEAPHQRWSHLFINGIYWGPYLITERVDDHFMDAHYGDDDYSVVKQGAEAVDGEYADWAAFTTLVNSFTTATAAQKPGIYAQIFAQADMANYVDYLLAYTYAQASDWPGNNHRMGKGKSAGAQWKFVVWDAEWSLRQGTQTGSPLSAISGGSGPAIIHARLKDYQPYRDFFSQRVNRALIVDANDPGSGALIQANVLSRFQVAMARFNTNAIYSESARWGYMAKAIPFTKSDPTYLPADPNKGDWNRSTNYIQNTWLPQRQAAFLNALQSANLYVPNP
jgi:hypothetical protein